MWGGEGTGREFGQGWGPQREVAHSLALGLVVPPAPDLAPPPYLTPLPPGSRQELRTWGWF